MKKYLILFNLIFPLIVTALGFANDEIEESPLKLKYYLASPDKVINDNFSDFFYKSYYSYELSQGDDEAIVFFVHDNQDSPYLTSVYFSPKVNGEYKHVINVISDTFIDLPEETFIAPPDGSSTSYNAIYFINIDKDNPPHHVQNDSSVWSYSIHHSTLGEYGLSPENNKILSIEFFPGDPPNPNFSNCFKNVNYPCNQKGVEKYVYDECEKTSCSKENKAIIKEKTFLPNFNTPYRFEGEISNSPIRMTIYRHRKNTEEISGSYYYLDKDGFSRGDIKLRGRIKDNEIFLTEYIDKKETGKLTLEVTKSNQIKGKWFLNDRFLPVNLVRY